MVYMAIAALFYSVQAFLMKMLYIKSTIAAYEVTYWQNMLMVIIIYIWMRILKRDPFAVPQGLRYTLILRNFTGFIGITGYYLAIQYTSLSKAAVLYWTNPMFTAVISACWLKEMISFIDWVAIGISFAGIIVIQNPLARQAIAELYSPKQSYEQLFGSLAAIVGAIFIAISLMQMRKLGKKVHFLIPPFYQALTNCLIAPVPMIGMMLSKEKTTHYGWFEAVMLTSLALCMFLAQIFQTKALQLEKAGRVTPVLILQIIFNYFYDYAIIRTVPLTNELIGGLMIVGTNLSISLLRLFNCLS